MMAPDGEVEDYQLLILPVPRGEFCNEFSYFDDVTAPGLPAGWTTFAELRRRHGLGHGRHG